MECDKEKCVLCVHDAEDLKSWEVNWSLDCAQSIHKLLDLELFSFSFFETASYCSKCKEIIRDVDFMTRSISALENRLSIARMKIAQMLLDNFSTWAGISENKMDLPISKTSPPNSPNPSESFLEEEINSYKPDLMKSISYEQNQSLEAYENNNEMLELGITESVTPTRRPVAEKNGFRTLRNVTESENYKFICEFPTCFKKFRTPYLLDCHKPTHIGWKSFACPHEFCPKAFTRRLHLIRHTKQFHNHNDRSKLLKKKGNVIEKPRKKKNYTLNGTEAQRTFLCDYTGCGSEFKTLYLLDCHKPTHIRWRAFKCLEESCQKTFRRRQHLVCHEKLFHSLQNQIENESPTNSIAVVAENISNTLEVPVHPISETTGSVISVNLSEITVPQQDVTARQPEFTVNESVSTRNDLAVNSVDPKSRRSTRLLSKPKVLPLPVDDDFHSDSDFSYNASRSDEEDVDLEEEEEIQVSKHTNNAAIESSSSQLKLKLLRHPYPKTYARKERTKNSENLSTIANQIAKEPTAEGPASQEIHTREPSNNNWENSGYVGSRIAKNPRAQGPPAQELNTRKKTERNLENISSGANVVTETEAQGLSAQERDKAKNLENFNNTSKQIAAECYTKIEIINKELYKCATSEWKLFDWETLLGSTRIPEETFESTFSFLFKLKQIEVEKNLNYNYKCAVGDCYRGFKTQDDWRHHLLIYHGEYEQIFECPFCTTNIFRTAARLDSHISRVHMGEAHPFFCPVLRCERRYRFKHQLHHHMTQQHPDYKQDEYICDDKQVQCKGSDKINSKGKPSTVVYCKENGCAYRTRFPKYLHAHMIKKHGSDSNTPAYKCDTCGRGFSCMKTYKHHSRHAHKGQEERSKCTFCPNGKTFPTKSDLNAHIRWKHMDVAPKFTCRVCTRVYFTDEDCKTHEDLHKTKGWSCVLSCGNAAFQTREELVKHVESTHEQIKEVVCHVCGFKTTGPYSAFNMDIHMKSHSREKTYKCKFCDKTARHFSELTYHEQMVHSDEPGVKKNYKCEECGEQFSVYLYFYRHRRNKHGSNPMPKFQRKKK